jgi:hypothetical protein
MRPLIRILSSPQARNKHPRQGRSMTGDEPTALRCRYSDRKSASGAARVERVVLLADLLAERDPEVAA